jgi:glutamyl-tRNA reductase
MVRIKALVLTYRDYDLDTLAKAYLLDNELKDLYGHYDSLIALQTCNRIEFYLDGGENEDHLISMLKNRAGAEPRVLFDLDAVKHLLLVTTGLDSMFFGEREILSQVKKAYATGKRSERLRILFESAIRFGENFRRKYNLSEISFIKFLSNFIMNNVDSEDKLLVIGGGEVARGVVRELLRNGYSNIVVANRTLDRLKYEFGNSVKVVNLESLKNEVATNKYDVWLAAISVKQPIISVKDSREIPDLIIDVSTPSAVDVDGTPVRIIRLEDLREPYLKYVNGKSSILKEFGEVDKEAERIMRLIIRRDADDVIRDITRFTENIREEEVREAINALNNGADPKVVVEAMSRSLVKKIMHNYLENIRALTEKGDLDEIRRLRDLFIMAHDNS